jgi:TetR/AcrR family transcriptional regulator, fatty acid metabolism regulator protein
MRKVASRRKAKSTGRAWVRRAEHRPTEILASARALLEQEGYAAVSVAQIAERAGVSEATVYKYFKNKQDLMNQVLQAWARPFVDYVKREVVLRHDLRSKLTLVGTRFLRSLEETPRLHQIVFQELRWNDYYGSPLHRTNQEFAHVIVEIVRDAIRGGEITQQTDPVRVRDMLFGGLEHIALRTIFVGRPIDIEVEANALVSMILDGITPQAAPGAIETDDVVQLVDRLQRAVAPLRAARRNSQPG